HDLKRPQPSASVPAAAAGGAPPASERPDELAAILREICAELRAIRLSLDSKNSTSRASPDA
ncbi:MAG: hypothetical protein HYY23_17740, partial [Verrucomicrobia bacterium]|nr:hypothetical protein [Verrucomicrobiota bacterium]